MILAYFGIKPRIDQSHKLDADVSYVKNEVPSVSVVTLRSTAGASELMLPSNLQAIQETTIDARTNGYVRARYVDFGDKVQKNQLLAVIESPEVDQQLLEAQHDVSKAQAGVGQARADVSRLDAGIATALSQVAVYHADLDQARADLKHLQAKALEAASAVDVAKAKLVQSQRLLDAAQAALQRDLAYEDIAKKTLARWKQLFKSDAVAGQDVDEKQADNDASVANVQGAHADISSAQANVQANRENVQSQVSELAAAQADVSSGQARIGAAESTIQSAISNLQAARAAKQAGVSNVMVAQAGVRSNVATAQRYGAMTAFEEVRAPFAGVITTRNVEAGDLVSANPGTAGASDPMTTVTKRGLFGLARTDVLLAQANVPEDSIASIRQGQPAEITVREYPAKTFTGHVWLVSGALDAHSRTLLVQVRLANPDGVLKPGMFAEIRFMGSQTHPGLRIPATAMIFDSKGTRVAIVTSDNKLHFASVTLGRDYGTTIEVLQGLNGGETVVTNPVDSLIEGETVKPISADAK